MHNRFFRFAMLMVSLLIAAALLWLIQGHVGWAMILAYWRALPASALLLALFLIVVSHGLRAVRLYWLLGGRGGFSTVVDISLTHTALNNLLPMRSGEFALPLLLRRRLGCGWADAVGVLSYLRLLDLIVLAGFAAGLLLGHVPGLATVVVVLWAGLGLWGLLRLPRVVGWLPKRWRPNLLQQPPRSAPLQLLLSITAWLAKLFALLLLTAPLDAAGWPLRGAAVLCGEVSSVLPLHGPAGFGSYEAAFSVPLLVAQQPLDAVVSAALNLHLLLLVFSLFLALLAHVICTTQKRNPALTVDS